MVAVEYQRHTCRRGGRGLRDFPTTPGAFATRVRRRNIGWLRRQAHSGRRGALLRHVRRRGAAMTARASPWTATDIPTSPEAPAHWASRPHRERPTALCRFRRRVRHQAEPRRRGPRLLDVRGGTGEEQAEGIAVNARGEAHITGYTSSGLTSRPPLTRSRARPWRNRASSRWPSSRSSMGRVSGVAYSTLPRGHRSRPRIRCDHGRRQGATCCRRRPARPASPDYDRRGRSTGASTACWTRS